jgi:hypothetical protein
MMNEFSPGKISDLFPNFLPGALNSLSPRSAFFTIFVERKGFTNLFFRLLDSSGKSTEMS